MWAAKLITIILLFFFNSTLLTAETLKTTSSEKDLINIFFNSIDYNYQDVTLALKNMNQTMQTMQGIITGNISFYTKNDKNKLNKEILNSKGFYDPKSDTIFINLNKVNFKKWNRYRKLLVKFNEARYDIVSKTKIVKKSPFYSKYSADAFSKELSYKLNNKGGKTKSMKIWFSKNESAITNSLSKNVLKDVTSPILL